MVDLLPLLSLIVTMDLKFEALTFVILAAVAVADPVGMTGMRHFLGTLSVESAGGDPKKRSLRCP